MALVQAVQDGKIVETDSTSKEKKAGNSMGQDQFLQLLVAQMQYQDPLEPTSNTEWVAQMATFSMVESLNNMQSSMSQQSANDLVGKYVEIKSTATNGDVSAVEGKVDFITKQDGKTMLSIDGKLYDIANLMSVADAEYYEGTQLAETLEKMVQLLPTENTVTLQDEGLVKSARETYESMTESQKKQVGAEILTKLHALENKLDALKATQFESMVRKLPSEETLASASQSDRDKYAKDIEEARAYYDELTDTQKAKVSEGPLNMLSTLEETLESLLVPASAQDDEEGSDENGEIAQLLKKILEDAKTQG